MISKYRFIWFLTVLIPFLVKAQGLHFNSNNMLIEERTSYRVFEYNNLVFEGEFKITFKLKINSRDTYGNIISIGDQNSLDTYSLTYVYGNDQASSLKFNQTGKRNLLNIPLDGTGFYSGKWMMVSIDFNPVQRRITISVNGKKHLSNGYIFDHRIKPDIYFGKHESVIDVPDMSISQLKITGNSKDYLFEFMESSGETVYDSHGKKYGKVIYPNWLIKESYHWRPRYAFSSDTETAITFNRSGQEFIIVNQDSIFRYDFRNSKTIERGFEEKLPVAMRLGMSFVDTVSNRLYVYEVNDVAGNKATISSIHLDSLEWRSHSTSQLPQQRHHHNLFTDFDKKTMLLFGGFGNQRLTNEFNLYDIRSDQWDTLSFKGDTISPRYFSGSLKLNNDEIILFGGIGNESGDQTLGKIYYYDCYRVNLEARIIKKLWELDLKGQDMVSGRNMILSADSTSFYALNYPEYKSSSLLQLFEYDLENGSFEKLGDSIPIISDRIRTNTTIYENTPTGEIFCVVQEYQLSGANKIKIYSINSPPVSQQMIREGQRETRLLFWLILAGIVFTVAILLWRYNLWTKRKKEKNEMITEQVGQLQIQTNTINVVPKSNNTVSLFGNFEVRSAKGKDISYLFSPNIKQLFILILVHSGRRNSGGVSSELIYEVLWPEKEVKQAKNVKNVTLNQLRKILEEMNGVEIIYSEKKFRLVYGEDLNCDYFKFLSALKKIKNDAEEEQQYLSSILKVINKGQFLKFLDHEYFDKIKKDLELQVLEVIPLKLKKAFKAKNYFKTIQYCDILYYSDALSELAFYYKIHSYLQLNLNEDARKHYNAFIVNYKKILDDDFPFTFREILKEIPEGLSV